MSLCFLCKNCFSPAAICKQIMEIPDETVLTDLIAHVNMEVPRLNKGTNIKRTDNEQIKLTLPND